MENLNLSEMIRQWCENDNSTDEELDDIIQAIDKLAAPIHKLAGEISE